MDSKYMNFINTKKINRNILNSYWYVFIVIIIVEIINSFFISTPLTEYLKNYLFLSNTLIISLLLIIEITNKYIKNDILNSYIIILSGTILASIIILLYAEVDNILSILFFPLIISVFYFSTLHILFGSLLNFTVYVLMYTLNSHIYIKTSITEFIIMDAILLSGCIILLSVMKNALDILNNLKQTSAAKQELLVKNVIMDFLSKTDALTDCYNHITFHEYLEELLKLCDNNNIDLHLALIDIDNFKKVNDTYGHRVGDIILKRVADELKTGVTSNDFVARYGGEEFAIIITGSETNEAFNLMEKIRTKISLKIHEELGYNPATVSIGLHKYHKGMTKQQLFEETDCSLYKAKRNGKNQVIYKNYIE